MSEIKKSTHIILKISTGLLCVPTRNRTGGLAVGYVRGSILEKHQGYEVWGGSYESVDVSGKAMQDSKGTWYGKWLMVDSVPVYQEVAPTVYIPLADAVGNSDGAEGQTKMVGYLTENKVSILSNKYLHSEKMIESLLVDGGYVLGEATESADAADGLGSAGATSSAGATNVGLDNDSVTVIFGDSTADGSATSSGKHDAAALQNIVEEEARALESSRSATSAIVSIPRTGGKEIVVSSGLINIWELATEDVVGKTMTLELIVSGGLIPGLDGRVVSSPIDYKVVGVFKDDARSLIYLPLSDLESMGVKKYTAAKILVNDPQVLGATRERIEAMGFISRSIADTLNQVERLFRVMRFLLGSFGMVAFIVALFGMFNTLTVSLLERTREIGVMKTLGTTDHDIMRLMVVEATLIGVAGGLAGIALGIIAGGSLDLLMSFFRSDSADVGLFQFPAYFLLFVFFLAVLVGMATGMYPANRAKKISALNALRYE